MFSKRLVDTLHTLSFRITLWYTGTFVFISILILSAVYYNIYLTAMKRTDADLLDDVQEFSEMYKQGGLETVRAVFVKESLTDGEDRVFFRVLTPGGDVVAASNLRFWGRLDTPPALLREVSTRHEPRYRSFDVPNKTYQVRTVFGLLGPERIIHIGESLEEIDEDLVVYKKLIWLLMIPVFLVSAVIGWLMARKALIGVNEVRLTALDITRGSYGKRVRVKSGFSEISGLAETFNIMLDRIQALLKSMREMNDNVAHDLRSPLARIRGNAEMVLVGKKTDADYKEMAISTIEECDNLIETINTMLDITEAEAGVAEFKYEKIDLRNLILDTHELFHPFADEKRIQLSAFTPQVCHIISDKHKLQRLVANILENAIKYTPPGGEVTTSVVIDDGYVHLNIKDTGIGIPRNEISKIFERFYRCDRSRSEAGAGLGLSLVKAILEAMHGDIFVESTVNQGTRFIIGFPAIQAP